MNHENVLHNILLFCPPVLSSAELAAVAVGQSPTACDREETRVRSMGSALPA